VPPDDHESTEGGNEITRVWIVGLVAVLLIAVGLAVTFIYVDFAALGRREPGAGLPEQGRRALVKYGCGACHMVAGVAGARGKVGPPLTGVAERAYIAGNLPNTPENLMLWVMDPQGVEPGTAMPNLGVTEEDARAITAFFYQAP
jgi:cytochrome c2